MDDPGADRMIAGATSGGFMLRGSRWKLVRYGNGTEALFDLRADLGEQENAIARHPDVRQRLDAELTRSLQEGMATGHADKNVPATKSPPEGAFHEPFWQRPYPTAAPET